MRKILFIGLFLGLLSQSGFAQRQIKQYEYWFDDNYSAKKLSLVTSSSTYLLRNSFTTEGLAEGLHTFHIRFQDNKGAWSVPFNQFFVKIPIASEHSINKYEYWFDDNTSGKKNVALTANGSASIDSSFSTNALPEGLHTFHIRFQDNKGAWSTVVNQYFVKTPVLVNHDITEYEYWFDNNYTDKIIKNVSENDTISLISSFTTGDLSQGLHTFQIRFHDKSGAWSVVSIQSFVKRGVPIVTWATPADITYGATLTNTQLCATANVAGTFKYSPALGTKLNAGSGQTLSVNFTPTDTINYESVSKTVQINVKKAIPVITWSTPADIFNGDVLSSKQLNATANVTGTFTYSPAIGTKLNLGNGQVLSTRFKASDEDNYDLATKQVVINVIEPVLSVSAPTVNINSTGKETFTITINSNCPWIATSGQRWLTVSPSSGTSNGTILLSALENNSVFDRTAVVTIKGSGEAHKTITVTQSKVLQIIANITRKWDDVLVCNNSEKLFINYQWYKNDVSIAGETKQYYYQESGVLNGNYYVKVTTSDGTSGISNTIDIINASRSIKAYPNPTENNQNFSLEIKASESDLKQAELTILSFSGQVVFRYSNLQQQMQLKGLSRGCYIIHIRLTDGELLNEKLMVN